MTSQVVESMNIYGSIPLVDFEDYNGNIMCPNTSMGNKHKSIAENFKIDEYTTLWRSNYNDSQGKISRAKASLSEGNAVVISMICPASFDETGQNGLWKPWESPHDNTNGRQHGRHAMTLVGYDNNKFGGAFEVQNSWGENFGNNGYAWIRYKNFTEFVYQAFEIVRLDTPKPKEPLLSGSLRLFDIDDKMDLEVSLAEKTRNWTISSDTEDAEYTYRIVPSLISGSKMRMYLECDQPAFVYMLGTGSVNTSINTLFPFQGNSAAMNYNNAEVALPSEKRYFLMDDTVGKDYIIVIFSREKLDIDQIRTQVSNQSGELSNRLKQVLGDKLVDSDFIDFSKNKIAFEVEQNESEKKAFAMIIEFDHVAK